MQIGDNSSIGAGPARHSERHDSEFAPSATFSVELVAVSPAGERPRVIRILARPDPNFLTHLIATAQKSPQTRMLRRAETADVDAAYRATASQSYGAKAMGGVTRVTI